MSSQRVTSVLVVNETDQRFLYVFVLKICLFIVHDCRFGGWMCTVLFLYVEHNGSPGFYYYSLEVLRVSVFLSKQLKLKKTMMSLGRQKHTDGIFSK